MHHKCITNCVSCQYISTGESIKYILHAVNAFYAYASSIILFPGCFDDVDSIFICNCVVGLFLFTFLLRQDFATPYKKILCNIFQVFWKISCNCIIQVIQIDIENTNTNEKTNMSSIQIQYMQFNPPCCTGQHSGSRCLPTPSSCSPSVQENHFLN